MSHERDLKVYQLLGQFLGVTQLVLADGELTTYSYSRLTELLEEAEKLNLLVGEIPEVRYA